MSPELELLGDLGSPHRHLLWPARISGDVSAPGQEGPFRSGAQCLTTSGWDLVCGRIEARSQAVTGKSLLDNGHPRWLSRNCVRGGPGARGTDPRGHPPVGCAGHSIGRGSPSRRAARECGDRDRPLGLRPVLRCAGAHRDGRRCADGTMRVGGGRGAGSRLVCPQPSRRTRQSTAVAKRRSWPSA